MFKSLQVFDFDYTYLDSGAPATSNYTTWVFVHGMGFNAVVFEKLLPCAHAHDLRIVSLNRRGYSPSSGFREEELAGIGSGKKIEEVEPFFRAQGVEIATFLVKFATEESIPLADVNGNQGGIVLIGWSLGGLHVFSLLAYVDEFPEDARSKLQKYLHTILLHGKVRFFSAKLDNAAAGISTLFRLDSSSVALGIPNAIKHDVNLWLEPDDRKRFDAFFDWTTAHYVHKSVTSENIDDLEFNVPSVDIPHSLHEISYEQRATYTDVEAFGHMGCDGKLLFCHPTAFAALTSRALFDRARAEKFHVRVRFMSGGETAGILVWAVWMLRKYVECPETLYGSHAEKARDIKSITQTEGNHFIFWEDPEKAIEQFRATVNV